MIKIEKLHKSYPIGDNTLHVLKGIDLISRRRVSGNYGFFRLWKINTIEYYWYAR